jgi:acyl-CoA synthetase (AMP-forming)/AMP-acid ligase II
LNIVTLLEMAATGTPDRVAIGRVRAPGERVRAPGETETGTDASPLTYPGLLARARAGAGVLRDRQVRALVYIGANGSAFAEALFASAWAGIPLVPLNYRLSREQLALLLGQQEGALVVSDLGPSAMAAKGPVLTTRQWSALCAAPASDVPRWADDPEATAVLLYTSGTSSAPKAAILRHRHLVSYLLGSVEFGAAGEDEAMLVSVPPYHIAGVSNLLSNVFGGRRIVYLDSFTPEGWLAAVRDERVTHALLVPTMLASITERLGGTGACAPDAGTPTLRSLAYGGARMPAPVLERAMRLFPAAGFVNAYGLTETSSTIAVLGPDDHRAALSGDQVARARLGSAGRLLPGIEAQVRAPGGTVLPAGTPGDIYVRGPQVSGEYRGARSGLDAGGWLATRDRGWIDDDGYLFIEGRADDTIIRGGENVAPAEIEDVLLEHRAVAQVAVVGLPDERWGQSIAAAVVPRAGHAVDAEELRDWVRSRLRGSKTPELIVFRDELPHTPTGKLLRREVLTDLLNGRPEPSRQS